MAFKGGLAEENLAANPVVPLQNGGQMFSEEQARSLPLILQQMNINNQAEAQAKAAPLVGLKNMIDSGFQGYQQGKKSAQDAALNQAKIDAANRANQVGAATDMATAQANLKQAQGAANVATAKGDLAPQTEQAGLAQTQAQTGQTVAQTAGVQAQTTGTNIQNTESQNRMAYLSSKAAAKDLPDAHDNESVQDYLERQKALQSNINNQATTAQIENAKANTALAYKKYDLDKSMNDVTVKQGQFNLDAAQMDQQSTNLASMMFNAKSPQDQSNVEQYIKANNLSPQVVAQASSKAHSQGLQNATTQAVIRNMDPSYQVAVKHMTEGADKSLNYSVLTNKLEALKAQYGNGSNAAWFDSPGAVDARKEIQNTLSQLGMSESAAGIDKIFNPKDASTRGQGIETALRNVYGRASAELKPYSSYDPKIGQESQDFAKKALFGTGSAGGPGSANPFVNASSPAGQGSPSAVAQPVGNYQMPPPGGYPNVPAQAPQQAAPTQSPAPQQAPQQLPIKGAVMRNPPVANKRKGMTPNG